MIDIQYEDNLVSLHQTNRLVLSGPTLSAFLVEIFELSCMWHVFFMFHVLGLINISMIKANALYGNLSSSESCYLVLLLLYIYAYALGEGSKILSRAEDRITTPMSSPILSLKCLLILPAL